MKHAAKIVITVCALACLAACTTPSRPAVRQRETWTPTQEERIRAETLVLDYVKSRNLLAQEEFSRLLVEVSRLGYVLNGNKQIGVSLIDKGNLPANLHMFADGELRKQDATVVLVILDLTNSKVVQTTIYEGKRKTSNN